MMFITCSGMTPVKANQLQFRNLLAY